MSSVGAGAGTGEDGKLVAIHHPFKATDIAYADDASKTISFVPGSPVPASLNGIPFKSWVDVTTTLAGWNNVSGQVDMDEPTGESGCWRRHLGSGWAHLGSVADERVWWLPAELP